MLIFDLGKYYGSFNCSDMMGRYEIIARTNAAWNKAREESKPCSSGQQNPYFLLARARIASAKTGITNLKMIFKQRIW